MAAAVAEDKDAYRAELRALRRGPRRVRPRVAPRAAHRGHRALRRARPAHRARRGVAAHAPGTARAGRASAPADASAAGPRGRAGALPRDGLGGDARSCFVNGALSPELSSARAGDGPAVEVDEPARAAARRNPGALRGPTSARVAAGATASSPTSTRAFAEDGAVVLVAPGAVVERADPPGARLDRQRRGARRSPTPRTLVVAGRGSESRIVESFVGARRHGYLAHERRHRDRGRGRRPGRPLQAAARGRPAALHVATLAVQLGRDARFVDHSLSLRGRALAQRHRRALRRRGRRVHARRPLRGRRPARGGHPLADRPRDAALHEPPALQGHPRRAGAGRLQRPRGRAAGRAEDRRRCRRTATCCSRARRSCTRRRSSRSCADDVKCKHGSTTGQLDEDALFYLRSRGIGEAEARGLLTWAFASDVVRTAGRSRPLRAGGRSASCRRACPGSPRPRGGAPVSERDPRRERRRASSTSLRRAARVPDPARDRPRQAARLPRLRGERAEAAGGDRRRERASTSATTPTSTAACTDLSMLATEAYEGARAKVARFLGAAETREIVLRARHHRGDQPRGAELRPQARRRRRRDPDHRPRAPLEHRARGRCCARRRGRALRVAPIDDAGEVDMAAFERLLSPRTRIVAVAHVSNALGTVNPVRRMIELAHAAGAVVLVDGAQAAPHLARRRAGRSAATSTPSPGTRCTARRASAPCTAARRCSRRCRPGRAAAT